MQVTIKDRLGAHPCRVFSNRVNASNPGHISMHEADKNGQKGSCCLLRRIPGRGFFTALQGRTEAPPFESNCHHKNPERSVGGNEVMGLNAVPCTAFAEEKKVFPWVGPFGRSDSKSFCFKLLFDISSMVRSNCVSILGGVFLVCEKISITNFGNGQKINNSGTE